MSPPADDPLDMLLDEMRLAPVADDGFADRVMARLPPPRRRRHIDPLATAACLGAALGTWQLAGAFGGLDWSPLLQAGGVDLATATGLALGVAIMACLTAWGVAE